MMRRITVDIWSDVMCPWCAVGWARFSRALDAVSREIDVDVRWMPFELNPDLPQEGKDQAQHLAQVYGRSPEEVAAMRAQMAETAEKAGFSMRWTGEGDEPAPMMWNTFDAHKLLRWALAEGGPAAQTRLKIALFRAHFQQRLNVSDRQVLLAIAETEGFDRAKAASALGDEALAIATRMEERRGREAGVNSVPTFVFEGRYAVPGAQEVEVFQQVMRKVAEMPPAAA